MAVIPKRKGHSASRPKHKGGRQSTKDILDSNLTNKQKYKLIKGQEKTYRDQVKQTGKTARKSESASVKKSVARGTATTGSVGAAAKTEGGDQNVYYIQNGGIGEESTDESGTGYEENPYGSGATYGN